MENLSRESYAGRGKEQREERHNIEVERQAIELDEEQWRVVFPWDFNAD